VFPERPNIHYFQNLALTFAKQLATNLPAMKKTIFRLFALPAIALATAGFLFSPFSLFAQTDINVQDDAKVGIIVTGTGNIINTTQIFGKSPEYAELKKRLNGLQAAISKKADACEQMAKDSLPAKYRDNCRAELIALNAERDSVQKIETRFREDLIRLAESFSKIELNSRRLFLADSLFREGKIREAETLLNFKEITQEGNALLAQKERAQQTLQMTDSLLRIKADEFTLKARLKATDYADPLRYDSATLYFEQSRRYAETVENLQFFAYLLWKDNQTPLAIFYGEAALLLPLTESEEAALAMNLGLFYYTNQQMAEAEKFYLRSLEIYERLAKNNPAQFEPDLARMVMNLGNFYYTNQKIAEAEKFYLHSLEIREQLAKNNPAQFEPDLARTAMNLGIFYKTAQKMAEAERFYLHSLEIYERLAKNNPAQFEPDLAKAVMNLGNFYYTNQKMAEAEKFYLHSLETYERLAKNNPAQFEPDLAMTVMNLGNFYSDVQKMAEAEKFYLRSLEIYGRLAKNNPAQFEPDLAMTVMNLGIFYKTIQKIAEAEKFYLRSLETYERLAKNNPAQFEFDLARMATNLGNFYSDVQKMAEAEKFYLRSLETYERLAKNNPAQFEPYLATTVMNLGNFYATVQKMAEAEKFYLRSLEIRERLAKNNPAQFEPELAQICGNMSFFYLFVMKFSEAQVAAERVLIIDPTQNWMRGNLGHSWLLRGDWDKAKQAYEQYISIGDPTPAEAKAYLLQDWDDLEKAGVMHPDMAKARAWVKE